LIDEPFRRKFLTVAQPLIQALAQLGVTPNHVTVAAFVLGLVAAVLVGLGRDAAALAVWVISRVGDGLDGALARVTRQSTPFGGYLDITLDMAAYSAVVLGFSVRYPHLGAGWAAILVGYVLVITTTLALSDAAGALDRRVSGTNRTFQFTPALTEGGETNLMYLLWLVFPAHIHWLVWVWTAALLFTVVQRTHLAWRVLR
jgi:phosphatidylglycerophosphate synthase